jgi:hypothetical protein
LADYDATIRESGGQAHLIPPRRCRDLFQAWRRVYAAGLFAATCQWTWLGYDWHVFSYRHAPAHAKEGASRDYASLAPPPRTIVCPQDDRLPAFEIVGGKLPDFGKFCQDIYVWPDGLDWTMAFTHEDGWFGPYFSRREWVEVSLEQAEGGIPRRWPGRRDDLLHDGP